MLWVMLWRCWMGGINPSKPLVRTAFEVRSCARYYASLNHSTPWCVSCSNERFVVKERNRPFISRLSNCILPQVHIERDGNDLTSPAPYTLLSSDVLCHPFLQEATRKTLRFTELIWTLGKKCGNRRVHTLLPSWCQPQRYSWATTPNHASWGPHTPSSLLLLIKMNIFVLYLIWKVGGWLKQMTVTNGITLTGA